MPSVIILFSVSSTTNSRSKLYDFSYSKDQPLSKESRNSNAKEKCYSQTPKLLRKIIIPRSRRGNKTKTNDRPAQCAERSFIYIVMATMRHTDFCY